MDFKPLIIINSRKPLGDKQAFKSLNKFLTSNEKKMSTLTSISSNRDALIDVPEDVVEKIMLIVSDLKQTQDSSATKEADTVPPSSKKRRIDESSKVPKSEKKKKRHKKD